MKKYWTQNELEEFWQILPEENILLGNKQGIQKLSYLLVLKFYAIDYVFPKCIQDIPSILLRGGLIYHGVKLTVNDVSEFLENNYSYSKYKQEIRQFYGTTLFNKISIADLNKYLDRLALDIIDSEKLAIEFRAYLKQKKIELPSSNILDKLIKKSIQNAESRLFNFIMDKLPIDVIEYIDSRLLNRDKQSGETILSYLKQDSGKSNRDSITVEINKLELLNPINLKDSCIPDNMSLKVLKYYKRKIQNDTPEQIRSKPKKIRYPLMMIYCYLKRQEILDNLGEHLVNFIHKVKKNESKVESKLTGEISKLSRVTDSLYMVAEVALNKPSDIISNAIYPVVPKEQLEAIIQARYLLNGLKQSVQNKVIQSYCIHYRKRIFNILANLDIKSTNVQLLSALELIKKYQDLKTEYYPISEKVPLDNIVNNKEMEFVIKSLDNDTIAISRKDYEYAVFKVLRDKLKTKEAWITGAFKYRDPEHDVPSDFELNQIYYYGLINQPLLAPEFTKPLKARLTNSITNFAKNLPANDYVKITTHKNKPWIKLSPLTEQPRPKNLDKLKEAILAKWNVISLLDFLKEVDLRECFTSCFNSSGNREILSFKEIQKRLILCIFGIGTNTGMSRIASSSSNKVTVEELKYIKRKFINQDDLQEAITMIVNGIFRIRDSSIWGEATTACASDSRKFTSWDQNLMTEWHARYHGAGVMIYWHVSNQSICIHSQLKTCSSSEVASMLQGILNQETDMLVESQYVDTHGKSEIGFAFSYLLGFDLLPRYATIGGQKIYVPYEGFKCENISDITTRPINWELIETHYDSMIKYAVALKTGTATADSIIRQFSKSNYQNPVFKALIELGRAVKSIFLCRYLDSLELRQEIHSGLNIVENWNSVNDFIFYGKKSEISANSRDEQEYSMLCLHLLQVCLAYVNILLIQDILNTPEWKNKLTPEDLRALTPLIYQHINPYGTFDLDMLKRIDILEAA